MPFIEDILKYKSLSIVGLEKNTGKTECLNYILKRLKDCNKQIAITSIGIDGEGIDQVTLTHKPEIEVYENMIFVTSEKHYRQRQVTSEILDISKQYTSLGRLVTAKSKDTGKVMFSGPAGTIWLKQIIEQMNQYAVNTTIVDGALSRMSLSSPAITQSMILATGAAVSGNIPHLVKKTKFAYDLIRIEAFTADNIDQLLEIEKGIWAIDKQGDIHNLNIPSVFLMEQNKNRLFEYGNTLFIAGAVSDKLLNFLRIQKEISSTVIIVKDFTKLFVSHEAYHAYIKKGGQIKVLLKTQLIAVSVNPVSPQGFTLNSEHLEHALSESLQIPVYNIKKI